MRERLGICEFYQVSTKGTKLLEFAWEILYDRDVPQVYIHQCDVLFNGNDESMESIFLLNYRNMEVWGVYQPISEGRRVVLIFGFIFLTGRRCLSGIKANGVGCRSNHL